MIDNIIERYNTHADECSQPVYYQNAPLSPVSIQTQSLAQTKTARNASAFVGKQPIIVATVSTEHSYNPIGWRLRLLRENLAVFVYGTYVTQAIALMRLDGNRAFTIAEFKKKSLPLGTFLTISSNICCVWR